MVIIVYTILFHANIFFPSKFQNGSILNNANSEFMKNPMNKIGANNSGVGISINAKKSTAREIFTNGPDIEIIPFLFFPTGPEIMTAPGAAKIKPKKDITIARKSILSKDLNSAKQP